MPNNQGAQPYEPNSREKTNTTGTPVIRDLHCGALDLGTSPVFGIIRLQFAFQQC